MIIAVERRGEPMDDLISRQAALDALWRTSYIAAEDRQISVTAIKALPNFSTTCQLDCISRQAAIDAVGCYSLHNGDKLLFADKPLKELPSAQPQRKKGHWIIKDNPGTGWYRVTCSGCGEDVTSNVPVIGYFPNTKVLWDFCPDCGAQMEGQDGNS